MAFYPEYLGMQMPVMQLPKVQNCNLNAQLLETASEESFISSDESRALYLVQVLVVVVLVPELFNFLRKYQSEMDETSHASSLGCTKAPQKISC